jgi:hypothetical protein
MPKYPCQRPIFEHPQTIFLHQCDITKWPIILRPIKVMVNQSHYRPRQARRVPGGWSSQILSQSAHEGGKVVRPTHRPILPPGIIPGTHLCRGWVDPRNRVRPEELYQWKIPMTPSGIDSATSSLYGSASTTAPPRAPLILRWPTERSWLYCDYFICVYLALWLFERVL